MSKLKLTNLQVSIASKQIIKNLNLEFSSGKFTALVGSNGAGKSTLLKAISNLGLHVKGEIYYKDKDLRSLNVSALSKIVAYMAQFSQASNLSVWEILALGRRVYSGLKLSEDDHKKIEEISVKMGIERHLNTSVQNLSGGQRQKIFILSALLQEPKILLLDEPISHLDPKNQHQMLELIKDVTKKNNLISIAVLHDIHHALHYADELVMLKDGGVIGQKSSKDVSEEDVEKLYDMPLEMYVINGHKFIYYTHSHLHL